MPILSENGKSGKNRFLGWPTPKKMVLESEKNPVFSRFLRFWKSWKFVRGLRMMFAHFGHDRPGGVQKWSKTGHFWDPQNPKTRDLHGFGANLDILRFWVWPKPPKTDKNGQKPSKSGIF